MTILGGTPWAGVAPQAGLTDLSRTIVKEGSTKLSKRIGWLNNNAGLSMQIKYSEVKDMLDALGESGAMKLLKELEEKKDKIRDPTAYLKTAAKRATGGSSLEEMSLSAMSSGLSPDMLQQAYSPELYQAAAGLPIEGGEIERRVGWLNANVQLQEPLIYDKVGPLLAAIGDQEALLILKKLEESSADVRDPTGWVIAATRRVHNQVAQAEAQAEAAQAAAWNAEFAGAAALASYPNGPVKGVMRTIPSSRAVAVAGSAVLMNQLKKRIGWLNANVPMKEQIIFDKVGSLLAAVGYRQAMEILKHTEEKAATVNDPTAYVAHAARKAAAGGAHPPSVALHQLAMPTHVVSAPMDPAAAEEKLRKRINWLNGNVPFAQPLTYEKVAASLLGIDSHDAMSVLKKLEENATSVRDPDGWVITAAARRAADGSGQNGMTAAQVAAAQAAAHAAQQAGFPGMGLPALPPTVPGAEYLGALPGIGAVPGMMALAPSEAVQYATWDGVADEKIRKRVGWLNRNVQFAADLKYDRVGPALQPLGAAVAMEILKSLEENAASIRDPTAYVVSAAQKRLGGPVPVPGLMSSAMKLNEDDTRLRKRIGWLNRNVTFAQELRYDQASQALLGLNTVKQMEILKVLEENAASIPDPTAYVVAAAAEAASAAAEAAAQGFDEEFGGPDETPEDKLKRRIEWMNKHLFLPEPIQFERIAPDMLILDSHQSMDILKKLEEHVSTVRDPHAWVNSAAKKVQQQLAAGAILDITPSSSTPRDMSDPTDRLRKRMNWMNANVALSSPLDFNQLAPILLRLEISQAMAVLKKLEEGSSTILDPNTYVTTAVDSLLVGGGSAVPQGESGALDDALRKRISWMNANVPLAVQLNYEQLQQALLALGDRAKAMEVLKKLESNALDVQDPNEYVANMATAYLAV